MPKVRISRGKPHVLAAPRRNGDAAKSIKGSASPAIATPAAVAVCAGRVGSGSGVKHVCADGSTAAGSVARANSKRSGIDKTTGRGAVTGNSHGRVGGHSLARKRVRVVDEKLGTFVVFLARYEGGEHGKRRGRAEFHFGGGSVPALGSGGGVGRGSGWRLDG